MFSSSRAKADTGGGKGHSFIAADIVVTGVIAAGSQIQIDGRIEGSVRADTLIQGASGTILGDIVAESAQIGGLIDGAVRARIVTLEPTARITGDVTYETLSIAAGAAIEGRLTRKEGPVIEPPPAPELPLADASPDAQPEPTHPAVDA